MTGPAPETPDAGDETARAPKRFIFLRKKAPAEVGDADGSTVDPPAGDASDAAGAATDDRVRPGVLRRRRRQLLAAYEQAIFDLGGLALEMHARGLLAEDVLRRRAAEVSDLRSQINDLDGRLDELKQARQERRHAGRGASVTCPNCGHRSPATARFCSACGVPLEDSVVSEPTDLPVDQPTEVVMEEQVTSVIIEAPDPAGQTQVIPPDGEGER